MASPTDAHEPEPPDEEEEEEIIEAGFDPLLFWDQYRQVILLVGGIVLLALVGYGCYTVQQSHLVAAAGAALAQASTDDDYRQVIEKFSGTKAAGDACLRLAAKLRDEKKYGDALTILKEFQDKYPNHPLASGGDLSVAETLDAEGKTDEAISKYEEVAAKYPDTYSAPVAVLAQANDLKNQGKTEEARRVYENFISQFPDSILAQQAIGEMHMLRSAPGAAVSSATPPHNVQEGLLPHGMLSGSAPSTGSGAR